MSGGGTPGRNDLAVTAVADNSTFAVTYFPSARKITFDLTKLTGSEFRLIWFNPRTGKRLLEGRMGKLSKLELEPPEAGDWLLLVE